MERIDHDWSQIFPVGCKRRAVGEYNGSVGTSGRNNMDGILRCFLCLCFSSRIIGRKLLEQALVKFVVTQSKGFLSFRFIDRLLCKLLLSLVGLYDCAFSRQLFILCNL
jgi:hypothetical protein